MHTPDNPKEKLSSRISRSIQMDILNGLYPPESRLPSERDLALQFKVSRVTIREAMEKLEQLGMVEKRPNSGSYVCDLPARASISLLTEIMNHGESVDAAFLMALLDFRQVIEVYSARRAARNASSADIVLMKKTIAQMKRNLDDTETVSRLNVDLHTDLNRLSGNLVIQLLFNSFKSVYTYYMDVFHRLPEASKDIVLHYEKLVAAIEARDDQYAAHVMEALLCYGHNRVKDAAGLTQNGKQVRLRPGSVKKRTKKDEIP